MSQRDAARHLDDRDAGARLPVRVWRHRTQSGIDDGRRADDGSSAVGIAFDGILQASGFASACCSAKTMRRRRRPVASDTLAENTSCGPPSGPAHIEGIRFEAAFAGIPHPASGHQAASGLAAALFRR